MLGRGCGVQRVAVEPVAMAHGELRKRFDLLARAPRLEGRIGLVEHLPSHRVRVPVRRSRFRPRGAPRGEILHGPIGDQAGPGKPHEPERERAARKDRCVVRGLIVLGRLALRPQLHGVESKSGGESQESQAA